MPSNLILPPILPQQPLQRLVDARRVLEISCEGHPFMTPGGRHAIRQAKRIAWATLAEVCEVLVETLDAASGDPDIEDATNLEDEVIEGRLTDSDRPGCPVADPPEFSLHERPGRQPELHQSPANEDREDDDPQGEVTDDEPAFDHRSRAIANGYGNGGPGCTISDPDYGVDDIGEREDA